jgi:hypothetical protein
MLICYRLQADKIFEQERKRLDAFRQDYYVFFEINDSGPSARQLKGELDDASDRDMSPLDSMFEVCLADRSVSVQRS